MIIQCLCVPPHRHFFRRRGQVVRRQTANLLLVGSIPTGASVPRSNPARSFPVFDGTGSRFHNFRAVPAVVRHRSAFHVVGT